MKPTQPGLYRLGNHDQAHAWFAKATGESGRLRRQYHNYRHQDDNYSWRRRTTYRLLSQEAAALLGLSIDTLAPRNVTPVEADQ